MRKTVEIKIPKDKLGGRDGGKTFLITEMPADPGEKWARHALSLMVKAGLQIDISTLAGGWSALAATGIKAALLALDENADPLLDEMMECVTIIVPAMPKGRKLAPGDIEEVMTIVRLREEVMTLHTGFSIAAALSKQAAALKSVMDDISNTQTLPPPSEP